MRREAFSLHPPPRPFKRLGQRRDPAVRYGLLESLDSDRSHTDAAEEHVQVREFCAGFERLEAFVWDEWCELGVGGGPDSALTRHLYATEEIQVSKVPAVC